MEFILNEIVLSFFRDAHAGEIEGLVLRLDGNRIMELLLIPVRENLVKWAIIGCVNHDVVIRRGHYHLIFVVF